MYAPPQEQKPLSMTEMEYLVFQDSSQLKHEFVNGHVFAMTGGSLRHNLICNNTSTTLINQLVDKNCIVPNNDTRVKVVSSYRYPDVVVICGKINYVDKRTDTISNPILLVEVLSPSTALLDRNQKFDEYIAIPSLQEYVLISQDENKVERFLRQDSGDWLYSRIIGLDGILELPSIGCQLALTDVYRKVELTGVDEEVDVE